MSVDTFYGELTFSKKVMREKLSKSTFEKLMATFESGEPLDESIADEVAQAMKDWAISKGATHFTHWFQPQRGGTAEKHDAFISYSKDGGIIEMFSASQLIQSEPDASSFPSGGMRSTFEARGYTAWDPTSPAFLIPVGNTHTLVIPSVFLSWTGHVLDIKTPMLRSLHALNTAAIRLQRLLGNRAAKKIHVNVGLEQEYFLITKELYETRPDLMICNRTLFGASPARGQQMEDHYFGAIRPRVLAFMDELDHELLRRGIPSKTRHNEVAPNQFEMAPLYEDINLGIDHNLQAMTIMESVADRHGLVVLVHEKPFAGVNGSGKHMNYSVGDNTTPNYFEPTKSPAKNLTFLLTIGAMLIGANKYGGVLRAAVADAGNDHRLGANEAPPAIMSFYLGDYLNQIFNEVEGLGKVTEQKIAQINMGIQHLPKVNKDISDRNRTSPLAFTGNKFEFRAVGSSANPGDPATIMNLILSFGFDAISDKLENMEGDARENAYSVLQEFLKETKRIRFEGDGYSDEWHKEAEKRGLPNAKNTPSALAQFLNKETLSLFEKYKVLCAEELHSKIDIKLEAYTKTKEIEVRTAVNMCNTLFLPALTSAIKDVAKAVAQMGVAGVTNPTMKQDLETLSTLYTEIKAGVTNLQALMAKAALMDDLHKQAHMFADEISEVMLTLRKAVDAAEVLVAEDLWPVAKYQDLLMNL